MRKIILLLAALLTLLATPAYAEGESIQIVSQDCDGIMVRGGGYTPGQTLLTFARAPGGEGTITDQKTVKANEDGMMPTTTLTFGGQVPDGTYHAIITTPGGTQATREEVTKRFEVSGCGPEGGALPFTGDHTKTLLIIGISLIALGASILRNRSLA